VQHPESAIPESGCKFAAAIGGAVIDDDRLELPKVVLAGEQT